MTSRWHRTTRWRRYWGREIGVAGLMLLLTGQSAMAASVVPGIRIQPMQLAQHSIPEEYTVRRVFPNDGSRLEVYDRSGRRTATLRDRSFGSMDRWEMKDPDGRRIGEVRRLGTSHAPRWEIYDTSGRRTGTVREIGSAVVPRWEVYDEEYRLKGTARPAPLETDFFRQGRENQRAPRETSPSSRDQESAFGSRLFERHSPLISTVPSRPTSMSSERPKHSWYMYGSPAYPAMPTPPVPPSPPTFPFPPTAGGQWPWNPEGGKFGMTPLAPRPGLSTGWSPRGRTIGISSPTSRPSNFGNVYEGFGHGNVYTGYTHGNQYDGFGHGGNYLLPDPMAR